MKPTKLLLLLLMLIVASLYKSASAQTHEIADSLWYEAVAATEAGELLRAAQLFEQSADTEKKCVNPRKEDLYYELINASYNYHQVNEFEKAFALRKESLNLSIELFGKDHENYGHETSWVGWYYNQNQDYENALYYWSETVDNTKKRLGIKHSYYGIRLSNLASLHETIGQYDKALPLFLEALENTEKSLGKEHSSYGIRLNNLAGIYQSLGQFDKALPLYLEALENTEKSLGKNHSDYGVRLNNLASLYNSIGHYDKALPLYLEALENTEKSLGKQHPYYGIRLNNLATLYENMGQYNQALPLYLEALENTEKSLGEEHSEYGIRLNNLAILYERMGQYDKALRLYNEALENTEKSLGKQHLEYGIRINSLAGLYQKIGQYNEALALYLDDQRLKLNLLERNFSFLSENEQDQYAKTINYNFEIYQSFYTKYSIEKPNIANHAFDIELATKGMILQSGINMRQAVLSSGNAEALELFDEWIIYKNILASEYSKPIAERRADLAEVEGTAEQLEADLTRLSQTFGNAREIGSTTWRDIQQKLKPGEVAVEFSSFHYRNDHAWTDSTLYTAIFLRPDDEHPHLIPLFEQAQLDGLLSRKGYNDAEFVSGLYRTIGVSFETIQYGTQLYELIWKPLEDYLNPGETIYFAPSGSLHQIAFAAIPVGEGTLLSDRYKLHQLSTTARLLEESRFTESMPSSMALYGGIDYDLEPEELLAQATIPGDYEHFSRSLPGDLSRGESWDYLPGTLSEVQAIETLANSAGVTASTFSGAEATEVLYKMQSGNESPQVLHIATHGFFFPDPERQTPDDRAFMSEETQVFRTSDNPLQRSGILFAGANLAWSGQPLPDQVEDGILTAYEVANVMLGNTQLVVLSACETGLGDIRGSEGVFGLQRAFKAAGAEYLLMSLWKVPDKETAKFMTHFYENWFSGSTIEQAFHATQDHMKKLYPDDPFKWAAFVLLR